MIMEPGVKLGLILPSLHVSWIKFPSRPALIRNYLLIVSEVEIRNSLNRKTIIKTNKFCSLLMRISHSSLSRQSLKWLKAKFPVKLNFTVAFPIHNSTLKPLSNQE